MHDGSIRLQDNARPDEKGPGIHPKAMPDEKALAFIPKNCLLM